MTVFSNYFTRHCGNTRIFWYSARSTVMAGLSALLFSACAIGGLGGNSGPQTTASVAQTANPADGNQNFTSLDSRAPVKVALILPLSGRDRTAIIAQAMKQAGEMALFDFDNPAVQLVVKDSRGTPEGAQTAVTTALSEGAELIIGPLFADSVRAIKPIAKQAKVPVIAFSSDPRVAGNGVYLLSFIAGYEIPRIVTYTASQGRRRLAALIPDGDYGKIIEARLRQIAMQAGITVAAIETYPPNANGMLAPVRRIKDAMERSAHDGIPVDALLIAADQTTLPMLSALLPAAGIDSRKLKLIGTAGWDTPLTAREKTLIGGWYPGPDPRGWHDFAQRYARNNSGGLPPRIASLAYDAVSIAINLSSGKKGSRYNAANLTRLSGFSGTDGLFRFTQNGLPERGLAILEVREPGAQVIDPAPVSFSSRKTSTASTASTAAGHTASANSTRFNLMAKPAALNR